jgi:hypothetical protein
MNNAVVRKEIMEVVLLSIEGKKTINLTCSFCRINSNGKNFLERIKYNLDILPFEEMISSSSSLMLKSS